MLRVFLFNNVSRKVAGTAELSPGSPLQLAGQALPVTLGEVVKQFGRPVLSVQSLDTDSPELIWLNSTIRVPYRGPVEGILWWAPFVCDVVPCP
jgi:hypothetical protein